MDHIQQEAELGELFNELSEQHSYEEIADLLADITN